MFDSGREHAARYLILVFGAVLASLLGLSVFHIPEPHLQRMEEEMGRARTGFYFIMGSLYAHGVVFEKDLTEASEWYRLAADKRHARAQNSLGTLNFRGDGRPQNYAEAAKWFRLAAGQGLAEAQYNLGLMHEKGFGFLQDNAEAVRFYQLAAKQGHVTAQTNLGTMYAEGRGVPQNYREAANLYRLAAEQGFEAAQLSLGFFCTRRATVCRRISPKLQSGIAFQLNKGMHQPA